MFNRDAFQREECSGEDACKETKDALFGPRYLDSGKYRQALKRDHRGGGQRRLSSDRRGRLFPLKIRSFLREALYAMERGQ